jgi:hypothetical protein|tara:strand:- start:7423 stop:7617 length:195 start_codon:yes stop_codon:yes gene_type:complete
VADTTENIINAIRKQIRDHMNEHADHLSGGACKDFEEYRYLTGVISGLALVERDILDLLERVDR